MTNTLEATPNEAETITINFEKGAPISINGKRKSSVDILYELNKLGGKHGIGVCDIVKNRLVGMKARGVYDAPAAAIIYKSHHALETICLDKQIF
jgi:argininosuccinate synthase